MLPNFFPRTFAVIRFIIFSTIFPHELFGVIRFIKLGQNAVHFSPETFAVIPFIN